MNEMIQAFYIPGLGDSSSQGQRHVLKLWSIYGVKVHYYPMYWSDDRSYAEKIEAFLSAIDDQSKQGSRLALIGTSAGASAVINAFAAKKDVVDRVVCISAKLNNPQTAAGRFEKNPSFKDSLDMVASSLASLSKTDRKRILSLHPIYDGVVPIRDTRIEGAHEGTEPVVGHAVSIAYALTLGSHRIANFLKS
jgi:pimeloyl-ACP methyl ester carboxylesterase